MTPWFNLFGTIKYCRRYWSLPGGLTGILMFLSGAFAFADSYIINSFVVAPFEQTTCEFHGGLVAYWGENETGYGPRSPVSPVAFWPVSSLATRALYAANRNATGVYTKIDNGFANNSAIFSPLENDIIGRWGCKNESVVRFGPKHLVNQFNVEKVIIESGFLYNQSNASIATKDFGLIDSIMMWSVDQFNNNTNRTDWKMRATFGNNLNESRLATKFDCQYNNGLKPWNRPMMLVNDAMHKWKDIVAGSIVKSDAVTEHQYHLEVILNAMTMVAASDNNLWPVSKFDMAKGQETTYGCKKTKNTIRRPVWVIAFILVSLIVLLGVLDLWNYYGKWRSGRRDIAKEIPFDFQEWQLMALKHMSGNLGLKMDGVRQYEYCYDKSTAKHTVKRTRRVFLHTLTKGIKLTISLSQTGVPQYNSLNDLEMFPSDGFSRSKKSAVVSYTSL